MKTVHMILVAAAIAASTLVLADPGFDAGQFGRMRGILDTCSKFDAVGASHYLLQMKSLIGNATKQDVDEAMKTETYQEAYQAVVTELANMDPDGREKACTGYLTVAD